MYIGEILQIFTNVYKNVDVHCKQEKEKINDRYQLHFTKHYASISGRKEQRDRPYEMKCKPTAINWKVSQYEIIRNESVARPYNFTETLNLNESRTYRPFEKCLRII